MVHQLYIKFSKILLPTIVQLRGQFGPPIQPNKEIASLVNSITNLFIQKLKNAGSKKLNNDILVHAGLNIIGKKIKK